MKKLLLASVLTLAVSPAVADVIIQDMLSGTGDNVVFDSFNGLVAVGRFNGQHQGLVDFSCLAGCNGFIGSANGNDIKIANTNDLKVQVFDNTGINVLNTATDVFSIKGTGAGTAFVTATESDGTSKLFTFDLGVFGNNQSGFTLTAINGETINSFRVVDVGGTITDFEHYRIDIAATAAVPGPLAGTGIPGVLAAFAMAGLAWRRRRT